jgi:glycosyltransferase involved in cell wall biosynthesis
MKKPSNISIIFPAYNEEENIEKAVRNCLSVLEKFISQKNYEIIVVDDGSKDKTGKIADELQKKYVKHVKVIHHQKNKGYASALRSGFQNSRYELIFYTDADNQFEIEELKDVVPLIKETDVDVVVGYRKNRKDPLHRLFISQGYNFLIRILLGIKVKDVDCSFKLFKREVLRDIEIKHEGWLVDTEILAKAIKKGYKIKEIPVTHYPRKKGTSTLSVSSIFHTFFELLKLKIELMLSK